MKDEGLAGTSIEFAFEFEKCSIMNERANTTPGGTTHGIDSRTYDIGKGRVSCATGSTDCGKIGDYEDGILKSID